MVPGTWPYIENVEKGLRRLVWERVRKGIVSKRENGNRLSPYGIDTQLFKRLETHVINNKYQMVTLYRFRTPVPSHLLHLSS